MPVIAFTDNPDKAYISMILEAIQAGVPFATLAASIGSMYLTRKLWLQSNRPVVTAFIDVEEEASGNMATAFNLVISNTGSRPAANVRLHAHPFAISSLFGSAMPHSISEQIKSCFSEEKSIAILRNGESLSTAFGVFGPTPENQWLRCGAEIPITVTYDAVRHSYKECMLLKIAPRKGFGGTVWGSSKS